MIIRVLYDYQIFTTQTHGGISRYFSNLIQYSRNDAEIKALPGIVYSANEYFNEGKPLARVIKTLQFQPAISIRKRLNRRKSIYLLRKGTYDIFHPTEFNLYHVDLSNKKPMVITVFDMVPEKFPSYFSDNENITRYIESKKVLVERADKIIAISHTTKKDILNCYPSIPEDKILVIHIAGSMQDIQAKPLRRRLPSRYILYVGTRTGYKNFDTFIRAAATVLKEGGGVFVVCCGGGDFNTDEKRLFSELGISDKIVYSGNISDQELKTVYSRATVFVFPSVYEGFGIPIVEAASAGCPLLLSDNDVFRELAGDCAQYFDPLSIGSIKESLSLVLESDEQRAFLGKKAGEIAAAFSWESTFNKTKELYKSLL